MEKEVRETLDAIKKLAQLSKEGSPYEKKKPSRLEGNSLLKVIRNEKEAKIFMAGLRAARQMAHEERELRRK